MLLQGLRSFFVLPADFPASQLVRRLEPMPPAAIDFSVFFEYNDKDKEGNHVNPGGIAYAIII